MLEKQTNYILRKANRGTAAMSPETRNMVSTKGGQAVSQDREHMRTIGRRGGLAVSSDRSHMAAIGRIGGSRSKAGAK